MESRRQKPDVVSPVVYAGLFLVPLGLSHIIPQLQAENLGPILSYSSPFISAVSLVLAKGIAGEFKPEVELSRGGEASVGLLNKAREALSTILIPIAGIATNIGVQTYGPHILKMFTN